MKIIFILLIFIIFPVYSQDTNNNQSDVYYNFGLMEGITIYGEYSPNYWTERFVLDHINGSPSERKIFIETEFLEGAGFRRTGNVRYRKTEATEKVSSVLYGIGSAFSFNIIPIKPFFETEHDRLSADAHYSFESVFVRSRFTDVSLEVQTVMKIEYMLQVEFINGIIIESSKNYYTDENIDNFEKLILSLPDNPETIKQAKDRFLLDLEKIKAALERYRNPSENYLRAVENLRGRLTY